ncbi:MAG: sigma-54-dependent Fis family transcriptional regulator [Rhodocyclaceae bacterium]|nr:MAG: sigma-54-dependent Fis family transcriptional regulator [Rhodocyclaceae bacterium]
MSKKTLQILVVEDDEALRDALCITLEAAGHQVTGAASGPAALSLVAAGREFHMVVSDLRMDPMDGLQLLAELRVRKPGLPVLLMTAFGDVDKAVAAMRGGACDFMLKPFEPKDLLAQIERYATAPVSEDLVAEDPATRQVLLLAARVARSEATVLLTGESGVGKEVFARYIHEQSGRAQGPFVAINCAAIPDNLLEATLFGHEKGAFTGAQGSQAGKFEQAHGGTLLLDEISEMPLGLQAKLLRVLQEREVERVGGRKPIPVDIRVLATSNRNMAEEVKAGRFREDLFYRINVFPLHIPSLRERPGDLVPLAGHFLIRQGAREGRRMRLSPAAAAIIAAHPWPGNVRELENTMQRAMILASGDTVDADHLLLAPGAMPTLSQAPAPAGTPAYPTMASSPLPAAVPSGGAASTNMKDLERQHILDTLAKVGGSRKKAVELLGISERTLRYKLAQYRDEGHATGEE